MSKGLDPYAAPRSDSAPDPTSPSLRTGWKVYAVVVAVVQMVGLFFAWPKIGVTEGLDYAVTAVGTIGLFGYAYRRPLMGRQIWMLWGVLFPVWDVVMGAWVYPRKTGTGIQMEYFLAMLLFLPQYIALIRYGYSSRELWN